MKFKMLLLAIVSVLAFAGVSAAALPPSFNYTYTMTSRGSGHISASILNLPPPIFVVKVAQGLQKNTPYQEICFFTPTGGSTITTGFYGPRSDSSGQLTFPNELDGGVASVNPGVAGQSGVLTCRITESGSNYVNAPPVILKNGTIAEITGNLVAS